MKDSENNLVWLLIAASILGFTFWHQQKQDNILELQNCQSEFKAFKDGVIYGRGK